MDGLIPRDRGSILSLVPPIIPCGEDLGMCMGVHRSYGYVASDREEGNPDRACIAGVQSAAQPDSPGSGTSVHPKVQDSPLPAADDGVIVMAMESMTSAKPVRIFPEFMVRRSL